MTGSNGGDMTLHSFIAGGVGGVCSVVSGHPLDTIKVRLQTMHQAKARGQRTFTGLSDCAMQTFRHEGFLGLFKGLVPPLLAAVPSNAMFFMGSAFGRSFFSNRQEEELSNRQLYISGCFGGLVLALTQIPIERIKCILQTRLENSSRSQFYNVWHCGRSIYRSEGFAGLYRGCCITLIRDVPSGGAYILTYYTMTRWLGNADGDCNKAEKAGKIMLAGGMAGVVDWTLSIAPDTLKSRIQTAPPDMYPRGARDAFRDMMATEGPRGLFHGLSAVMLRAFISNAFCLLGYEITVSLLSSEV